ncbi:MAG: 2-oxoglutarate dehydrogenase complex dihydrolipoyllysine-residue succinyltransferase [Parvibaculales bacterium]
MTKEIRVPTLGESITEATVAQWYKQPGEAVAVDEPLCELETDKVTIEVPAPSSGVMGDILAADGVTVEVGAMLGSIEEGEGAAPQAPRQTEAKAPAAVPAADQGDVLAPSVRRLIDEHGLDPSKIAGTGKGGRLTKSDVLNAISGDAVPASTAAAPLPDLPANQPVQGGEERVRMTRLRQTIAKRLKDSQNTAAMLTTFNEVDMGALMETRSEYKEKFEAKHGIKLGFMSFFVKACVTALQEIPAVNAEIDGDEIVYKHYVNMGVAVGTDKGLVVPVIKNAQDMGFAEIEKTVAGYGEMARSGGLSIADLSGGTFTISNGGVYGSLMSTPILNAPQSGILGMHKIEQRPVVVNGEIVIRPMMYLALSYDHRIVDGKEAVTFLVRVKEGIENPERLLLGL